MDKKAEKSSKTRSLSTAKLFAGIFLILLLLLSALTGLIYYFENRKEKLLYQSEELQYVSIIEENIFHSFDMAVSDLEVLAAHYELAPWLTFDGQERLEALSEEFLNFAEIKQTYDQVRLLDASGTETVRAQLKNGQAYLIPQDELQYKGHRYYFEDTFQLNQGEIFVSPFDLNIEQGEIEKPLKPMIRFSTPVFDKESKKQGIVIINYLGKDLLDRIEELVPHREGKSYLINAEGYWLKGPGEEDEWGFMFEDKKDRTFGKVFPEEWQEISKSESGQFSTKNGLFTFTAVYPLEQAWRSSTGSRIADEPSSALVQSKDYYWKVIDFLPKSALTAQTRRFLSELLLIDAFITVIMGTGSWFLARSIARRREAEKRVFDLNEILKLITKILRHDISNDLTVIGNALEEYLTRKDDGWLANASKAVSRSMGTIDGMRKLESTVASSEELKSYRVRPVVEKAIQAFSETKVEFKIEGEGTVLADEALASVIENIVRNAIVHGKTNKIDITIDQKDKLIEIRIADYGKGIPDEVKKQLFQEGFVYGETGHTGLGLYIVRKTIERYGGKVWIKDNKPKGAVFILELPQIS